MNNYVTAHEIKQAMPDGIRETTTAYDDLLYRLAERVSRMIDRLPALWGTPNPAVSPGGLGAAREHP